MQHKKHFHMVLDDNNLEVDLKKTIPQEANSLTMTREQFNPSKNSIKPYCTSPNSNSIGSSIIYH